MPVVMAGVQVERAASGRALRHGDGLRGPHWRSKPHITSKTSITIDTKTPIPSVDLRPDTYVDARTPGRRPTPPHQQCVAARC